MLHFLESLLIGRLRSKITRTKTPVLAIIFRVPMPSVSPYPQGGIHSKNISGVGTNFGLLVHKFHSAQLFGIDSKISSNAQINSKRGLGSKAVASYHQ